MPSTLANLFPGDPVLLQTVARTLAKDGAGRYWLLSSSGKKLTPSGTYEFVTLQNGMIRVARMNPDIHFSTHIGISGGVGVLFAGTIRFAPNKGRARGTIVHWTNSSGHYRPPFALRDNANLPLSKFVTHAGGQ